MTTTEIETLGQAIARLVLVLGADDSAESFELLSARLDELADRRIQSALADERRKSLDLYDKGFNGLPEAASIPSRDVDGIGAGARRALVGLDLGDSVGEVTHGLAPSSLAGTESVGRSAAGSGALAADRAGDRS